MTRDNKRPSSKGKKKFGDKKERSPKEEGNTFKRPKKESYSEDRDVEKRESREKNSTSASKPAFKKDKDVSFKRYRDNARPSDFSTSRKRDFEEKERSYKKDAPKEKGWKDKEYSAFKKDKDNDRPAKKGKSFGNKSDYSTKPREVNPYDLDEQDFNYGKEAKKGKEERSYSEKKRPAYTKKPYVKKEFNPSKNAEPQRSREKEDGTIRLNKYISNAGICSRREADELIESGVVQVNGKTITEMGYRIKPTDIVKYGGQTLKKEKMVYLVLNKPKDYITTIDDPQKRRTVLELVQNACKERIYPVGRLDRATTGLLMFTNDGELTKKLTHPRYGVRKIYHVELDKPLKKQDLDQISEGLEL
ncbi:MAG TPA: pseudouridine synthase, partial [Bacteroidia bacterium]|nr:pseudouridine synthase [Bacteroidia bacterium]